MNVLLSACIKANNAEPILSFPLGLLGDNDTQLVEWVKHYYTSYGQLPSVDRLRLKFPSFVDFSSVTDPLGDVYEQTLARKRAEMARRGLLEANEADANDEDLVSVFAKYAKALQSTGGDVAYFSNFDRMIYLAPRNPLFFGMPFLDKMTKGVGAGELCYLVGRLNVGKSTIAQWLAKVWWAQGLRVFYASNESLFTDVFARIDAMAGGFNPLALRDTETAEKLVPRLKSIQHIASKSPGEIMIPKRRVLDVDDLFAHAMELRADAVIIDGVYLMRAAKSKGNGPYWERVTEVSREVKQNALATGLRVFGLHQTKRGTGTGERKMENDDTAYSDALAQDADFMIGIQKMEVMSPGDPERIAVELMKNRYGPRVGTTISIDFDTMTVKEVIDFVERPK